MGRIKQKSMIFYVILIFFLLFHLTFTFGQQKPNTSGVGVDEKLGQTIPLDLHFKDEQGKDVVLKQLIDKPTLVTLVYYTCTSICNPLLGAMAQVLDKLKNEIKNNFQVISLSFNPKDTPKIARGKKESYLTSIDHSIPEGSWRFLTGNQENIKRFTKAVGFKYKKDKDQYIHAATVIMISPEGKIIRYLYGISFLPFDIKMAVAEALENKAGSTVRKVLLYCFSYDPSSRGYVFNVTRVIGTVMLVFVALFLAFLIIMGRMRRKRQN